MSTFRIRLATVEDAPGILDVYAPYIDTPITFEEEAPAPEAFEDRVATILERYPYLVAETQDDGNGKGGAEREIVGYAYAHAQHERIAYQWGAELSVYLSPSAQGHGVGTALYRAMIALLKAQGVKTLYGLVTAGNAASDRLHEGFGFSAMGVQRHAGYTCGAWHDVTWYVKEIGAFEDDPKPPEPFPTVCEHMPQFVSDIIAAANRDIR